MLDKSKFLYRISGIGRSRPRHSPRAAPRLARSFGPALGPAESGNPSRIRLGNKFGHSLDQMEIPAARRPPPPAARPWHSRRHPLSSRTAPAPATSARNSTSMDSRCLIARSSGVTPIAARQSMPEMRILSESSCDSYYRSVVVQRFAAGKAGLDIVPVPDATPRPDASTDRRSAHAAYTENRRALCRHPSA